MFCIRDSYPEEFYQSNIFGFYFDGLKPGVIDIETTVLTPAAAVLSWAAL